MPTVNNFNLPIWIHSTCSTWQYSIVNIRNIWHICIEITVKVTNVNDLDNLLFKIQYKVYQMTVIF